MLLPLLHATAAQTHHKVARRLAAGLGQVGLLAALAAALRAAAPRVPAATGTATVPSRAAAARGLWLEPDVSALA